MRAYRRVASPDTHAPVTTLELFFDLVFVFVVTQLTDRVLETDGWHGYLEVAALLWVIWWMYDAFAWLSNNVGPTTTSTRLPMLVAMAAFLVIAIAVPTAFEEDRWLFAAGYLVVVLVHGFSFLRSSVGDSATAILAVAPINLGVALGLLLAAALPEDLRWLGWGLAVVLPLVVVARRGESGFGFRPAHFAERHRLMLIIALGESILAVGRSAVEHLTEPAYLATVVLAMVLVTLLWWLHFADDEALRRVDELTETPDAISTRTALVAFSFGYLALVGGLILVAAGLHEAVHDPGHHLSWRLALTMAVGAAVYLVANVFYLWRLGLTGRRWLLVVAVLTLPTALVGHLLGGAAHVVALVVLLLVALLALRHPLSVNPGRDR